MSNRAGQVYLSCLDFCVLIIHLGIRGSEESENGGKGQWASQGRSVWGQRELLAWYSLASWSMAPGLTHVNIQYLPSSLASLCVKTSLCCMC